jgi:RNA polymerase sigma factor (sigma-70 family)
MDKDTDLGGPIGSFPPTQMPLVRATASADPAERGQALAALLECYWKPIYKYLRIKWQIANEDAKDLTQGFFTLAMEKSFFEKFDPARARFRTYLRMAVDGFVANEHRASGRLKRGGGIEHHSLDFAGAEEELSGLGSRPVKDADEFFRREWIRSLFGLAVDELRRRCQELDKDIAFSLFARYDLDETDSDNPVTYDQLARELNIPVTQVTNHLAYARREFRRIVLDKIRSATGSDEDFRAEAHQLLGGDIP